MSIKKIRGSKYKITLMNEEVLILQDQVIIDYNILFRKEIDDELRSKITQENAYYEAYSKVMGYLVRKLRSYKETMKYLDKFELTDHQKQKMITKLKELNLLNDQRYAKSYVIDKLNFTNDGPLKLRHDLAEQQILEADIEEALKQVDLKVQKEKIVRFIEKKIKTNHRYSNYMLKQKIQSELIRLGYELEFINDCFYDVSFGSDHLIEKEYEKQYKRLSKKYSGTDLQYKIKEKLYAKGYSGETIREYLEQKSN